MSTPITKDTHHVGLTLSKLEESASFFTALLGWKEVRRNKEYPAIYVSDGSIMVTLWAIKEAPSVQFDKNKNVVIPASGGNDRFGTVFSTRGVHRYCGTRMSTSVAMLPSGVTWR